MKSLILIVGAFSTIILTQASADAAQECPSQVILSGPRFINNQKFPTQDQIRTNFDHMIHANGGEPVWSTGDLATAESFVQAMEKNVQNDQIVLAPSLTNGSCGGSFAGMPFNVASVGSDTWVEFDSNSQGNWPDSISIFVGNHSEVSFVAHLPSNCSNCSSSAELFEFQKVSISNRSLVISL